MRFRTFYTCTVVAVLLASPVTVSAASVRDCQVLSRSLSVGMSGADVLLVQQILNQDARTKVAASGPGSTGLESTYFGGRTKQAIITFQNLYAAEVLTPAGLQLGSGFIGAYTRAKLVTLCKGAVGTVGGTKRRVVVPQVVTPSITTPTPVAVAKTTTPTASLSTFRSDIPTIMSISSYTVVRGTTVSVAALGLASSGNVVHIGAYTTPSTTIDSSGTLSFTVADDVPLGKHELWITSSKGDTNKTFLIITDPNVAAPRVTSFTPAEGFLGQVVTVKGVGFLPTGNDVRTSYGVISNVASSDGKTLQFTVAPDISGLKVGEDRPEFDIRDQVWFTIVNANGLSEPAVFILKV